MTASEKEFTTNLTNFLFRKSADGTMRIDKFQWVLLTKETQDRYLKLLETKTR